MKTILFQKRRGTNISPFIDKIKELTPEFCRDHCEFSGRKFSFWIYRELYFPKTFAEEFSSLYKLCEENDIGIEIRKMRKISDEKYLYHVIIS